MCNNKVIVVEDHYPEGGLGSAVMSCFMDNDENVVVKHLCVRNIPRSGPAKDLMHMFGIDADAIVKSAKSF